MHRVGLKSHDARHRLATTYDERPAALARRVARHRRQLALLDPQVAGEVGIAGVGRATGSRGVDERDVMGGSRVASLSRDERWLSPEKASPRLLWRR